MFREEKIRFVNETYPGSEKSRKWVLSSLLVLEKYEDEWDMDFAMQDYDALQAAFNNVASRTYSGAKTLLIRFRKYAKWRMTNGLPCTDAVFRLEADRTIAMRDSMVSSPAHLQSVLDAVFDSPYVGTADVIYRVLLWMGFAGLSDTEAVRVTGDELDFGSMRISHKGSEYPMYAESKLDFIVAKLATEFKEGPRTRKRVEGNEIMRGKENKRAQDPESTLKNTIRPALTKKFEKAESENRTANNRVDIGFGLTFSSVSMSGRFYRMYQEEKDGHPPDFTLIAMDAFWQQQCSDSPYKISPSNPLPAILLRLRKSEESDYDSWKKAFDLE